VNTALERFAVVGSGAAALGVLVGILREHPDAEVTMFDVGNRVTQEPRPDNPSVEWINEFYDEIYKNIRSVHGFKFPPPKTHFGDQIPMQPVGQHLRIFKSESLGGLTNYWGATMLPFTDREMNQWPISSKVLEPYYERIAHLVGLAARPDALNEYFMRDFSTRPAIQPTTVLDRLDQVVNRHKSSGQFKVVSGVNRCAIETRDDQPNSCVYCGECMAGCFRGAIYSTRSTIEKYVQEHRICRYLKGRVRQIGQKDRSIEVETAYGRYRETGFSKIFLCAGCPASTEIVMRSVGLHDGPVMKDNAVYVFPILYLGRTPCEGRHESYLAQCNLIFGCIPQEVDEYFSQALIYPNFDYLWRYNMPWKLWQVIRPVAGWLRSRIFWGRLYVHSDVSQAYSMKLEDDRLVMEEDKRIGESGRVETLMRDIRAAVNNEWFYIPAISPLRQRTNSHYAGTLPFGGDLLGVPSTGEVIPGLYVCDSSCFPDSPAVSPTFTIMANACRIATEAVYA
jgi:choline dehydrogenase-like flavoprotein